MNKAVKITIGTAVLGGLTLFMKAFILERFLFEQKTYDIGDGNRNDQPIKIIHLSDLHFRTRLGLQYKRLATRINKIDPDIIFISGDSVDQDGQIGPLEKFLRLLKGTTPKAAILGNHEYKAEINISELRETYAKTNTDLLINTSKHYNIRNKTITVTGVDDALLGNEDFRHAVAHVGQEPHHFVLIHSPKQQESIRTAIKQINRERTSTKQLNIYCFFAGHNHGGQVKIGSYAPILPEGAGNYLEGWYNEKKPYLYLSKGFGTSAVPFRFWSRAELAVMRYYG